MNHYACYALKNDSGDYAWSDAVSDCSFYGGVTFSLGMDIYWDNHRGVVFSQKDVVRCEVEDGAVIWKTSDISLSNSTLTIPLIEGGWNHIDIVYSEAAVSLYINGTFVEQNNITGQKRVSEEPYHYLETYNGYLRNFRIIDYAMTEEQIQSNIVTTDIDMSHLWLYIPFDTQIPKDKGKYQKVIRCDGLCGDESIIKALVFSGTGYARIDDTSINPGAQGLEAYTIALRIYVQPSTGDKGILLENKGNDDDFQIYLSDN